mgnify:FL=1|tara:strand:+ start:851 stop:2206 length:1356 start_codon:yes stop_codon:yes gene_type:complete
MSEVTEAKVDAGKSPETKEKDRNVRKFGVSHNVAGHGKLRRALHRSDRGYKKKKGDKSQYVETESVHVEGASQAVNTGQGVHGEGTLAGYSIGGEIKKGVKRHKDAVEKKKIKNRKAVPYAALAASYAAKGETLGEEGYDKMRDKALEQGTWKEPERKNPPRKPETAKQKSKAQAQSQKAFDTVVAKLKKRYGEQGIMTSSKKFRDGKEVKEELAAGVKRIDAYNKAQVAKRSAEAAKKKAASDKSASDFRAHRKAELAKGKKPHEVQDSWNQKKIKAKKESVQHTYRSFIDEGNKTARMLSKSKSSVTGNISADRGDDEKKNREKRRALEGDLKKKGIGHTKAVGEYKYDDGKKAKEVSYQTSKPDKMSKRRFGKVMRRLGRKHGQESVVTKDKEKSAKLHYTDKSKKKSESIGKSKPGKNPTGYGETSGNKVRSGKLPKKTNKPSYHYG